jgi:hypothetical protein
MSRRPVIPAAPVGQQGPPAPAAASAVEALRSARAPPIDYGGGLNRLTPDPNTEISKCT